MTVSWSNFERRLFYRNPQFRTGRKNWDFGEGRVAVFHPLFPGETLNRINLHVAIGVIQDATPFPVEYHLGAWIVKAGDQGMQSAIDLWTGSDELASASDNSSGNDVMDDSQADTSGENMMDLFCKSLIINGSIDAGDSEYVDTFYDLRGSDNETSFEHWNPHGVSSINKKIWYRSGWLRSESEAGVASGDVTNAPALELDIRTKKDYKIWEPSFLVVGAFLPKVRVEEKFNWYYAQPGPTGILQRSGFSTNQNLWNPEVIEHIINSGINDYFDDAENWSGGDTAESEAQFSWYLSKMLQGDNYVESDTYASTQPSNDHKGWLALRGSAGIKTPINSMLLRRGNQWAS